MVPCRIKTRKKKVFRKGLEGFVKKLREDLIEEEQICIRNDVKDVKRRKSMAKDEVRNQVKKKLAKKDEKLVK